MYLGKEGNILDPTEENAKRIKLDRAILTNEELKKICSLDVHGFRSYKISLVFAKTSTDGKVIEDMLHKIFHEALFAIRSGVQILVVSDEGVDKDHVALPILLATAGLHNFLVKTFNRTKVSIVVHSAQPRDIHHFACLLGYGASAINPYLVYESINDLVQKGLITHSYEKAVSNFITASMNGIVKIASKMGISTLQSYSGAQIFEAIGISSKIINRYFCGTRSSIEGIDLDDILDDVLTLHNHAYSSENTQLSSVGIHGFRSNGGYKSLLDTRKEEHLYDPLIIYKLQHSCITKDYSEFKEYCKMVNDKTVNIRDCMELDFSDSISIDRVESVESIVQRFKTGAMSYGSISQEAHQCLAIAMNRIGGKSNTGEGGEYVVNDDSSARIKQIASARFGVSLGYLQSAHEIQIKIAQGAKPGEGGQLPASKVYPWIAEARHSTSGVSLISPPPHHDIYSIEDLAQLIFDLKNANESANISVKLASESGIGTVAAGVAKAGANKILVSGYDGGTGASPRNSIQNAGTPWELGLSEVHQTLILNGLRERVRIETDGKLLTGRDLAIAALLGADEFGFATAPLIVMGCTMMRVCNLNTCPFGIATQDELLRSRFKGRPEHVINFMRFIANDLREYMALLGFKTLNDMIGRSDKISKKKMTGKKNKISLDRILYNPRTMNNTAKHFKAYKPFDLHSSVDRSVILPQVRGLLKRNKRIDINISVNNLTSRTLGTNTSSKVLRLIDKKDKDIINITTFGNAGNSFGAFLTRGITLNIVGDANDYLGKGLSGGRIVARPSSCFTSSASENVIAGNVCLYGAIDGEVYLDGLAGERFCVRNSGANAVVLGVGMHGCEYMTGGIVVVLGNIGRNFAAGMSGGIAYVYGKDNTVNINPELVSICELDDNDISLLKDMISKHAYYTNSKISKFILDSFNRDEFFKVLPRDYERMLHALSKYRTHSDPQLSAFLEVIKS